MRQNNSTVITNDRGKKRGAYFFADYVVTEKTDFQGCGRMEVGGGGGGLFFERPSILGEWGGGQKGKERVRSEDRGANFRREKTDGFVVFLPERGKDLPQRATDEKCRRTKQLQKSKSFFAPRFEMSAVSLLQSFVVVCMLSGCHRPVKNVPPSPLPS